MARTKQTKHGGNSSRPTGMATVRFSDEGGDSQFKDIAEEDWPDLDKPPQAAEEGEASKSAGKTGEGEGSKAVGKPTPTGAEGGAKVPPNTAQTTTVNRQRTLNQVLLKMTPRPPPTPPRTLRMRTNQVL